MSISDLYSSGFRERNKSHFAAIVRVALSDGVITDEEKAFLDRLAGNLDIDKGDYESILENPVEYPVNPPTFYNARLERLYDLAMMVYADHHLGERQQGLLERLAVGLGFTPGNVKYVVAKALELVKDGVDSNGFKEEIRFMNR
ncbi:TerB family tellurite resistance protein [Flavobacteriaceae bacterium R38]|nr:TerB family tellurite resistance protein [Flavobacteriaceae bacterium R38]